MANPLIKRPTDKYRGRFAPSPSGLLHFGSLITALASYLHAKANHGQWLVRIEDIDPPREKAGASRDILKMLEAFGLYWDETELYQSNQSKLYLDVLNYLHEQELSYYCQCTRAQIKAGNGIYQQTCRHLNLSTPGKAIRLINQTGIDCYHDLIQGYVKCDSALAKEDFIIHRKDGLFAYQLAVVVDDIYQGITHVIRGCDLLEPTARQLTLFDTLNAKAPLYGHIPLAVTDEGYKLSKQNKAPAIDINNPNPTLIKALKFLGQQPNKELVEGTTNEIISWAIDNWQTCAVPCAKEIMV